MSLKQLIENCKKNDAKAQSQLYELFSGKLFAICLKYSRNYEEAQDNLHDSFLTIFKKIKQYNNKGSFEGWLKRVSINTALQRYRDKTVLGLVNDEQLADADVELDDDLDLSLDFLLNAIQELPDRYRLVFNLYVLDGYSHQEISDMLEISIGTSKSNLARARVILKKKIEQYNTSRNSNTV